jgi:hypothetical protein
MRNSPQNFLRMIADMGFLILNLPLRTTARKAKSSSFHGKPFKLEDKSCWEAKVGEARLCFHASTSGINVYELETINDIPLLKFRVATFGGFYFSIAEREILQGIPLYILT